MYYGIKQYYLIRLSKYPRGQQTPVQSTVMIYISNEDSISLFASESVSYTEYPIIRSNRETTDLPLPMPPVIPIRLISNRVLLDWQNRQELQMQVFSAPKYNRHCLATTLYFGHIPVHSISSPLIYQRDAAATNPE